MNTHLWSRYASFSQSVLRVLAAGTMTICAACAPAVPTVEEGNVGTDPRQYPHLRLAGEPNDSFDDALAVILDGSGHGLLRGRIATTNDVDVFDLGPLVAGDRVILDVSTSGGDLDAMLAVFDETGRIVFENDDRSMSPPLLDPFINQVIRHDSSQYFVAISRAPLAASNRVGPYEILVTVVRGGEVPPPKPQIVVLDLDGGTITIPPNDVYTIGPFDAGNISFVYAGQTAAVRDAIVRTVEQNYQGLAVEVRAVPPDPLPPAGTYSTVLLGGRDPRAFGIAQNIDAYNADDDDAAIVFTNSFTPGRFGRVLSIEELGTAIGNVVAHELGHLLGLNHTADPRDLMDTTGDTNSLLSDQQFLNAPLDHTIFPIGTQDAWLLLLETLGLAWPFT